MSSLYDSAVAHGNPQDMEPPPPIEAVLFDFSNTLFQMIDVDVWLSRVMRAASRAPLSHEEVADAAAQLASAYRLPEVVAAQEGRDLSSERHRKAMNTWFEQVNVLDGIEKIA